MSQEKIQSIKLNKFRGATKTLEIKFDTAKKVVMIFGENGTGKSTIIDAMDFIFNKECGSLKEKSLTKIKNHYLPSLGSNSQDVEVSICSQSYKWKGKLNGSIPEIEGSNQPLLVNILRRSKILELVNAAPKKRYEALKNFIELPNIRSSESSLRDCLREIEKDINNKTSTNQNQKETLQESWEGEGSPGDDYLKWAEDKSKKQPQELKNKVEKYKKFITFFENCFENSTFFVSLNEKCLTSKKELEKIQSKLAELSSQTQSNEIVDILEKTQSFLQKETTEECPACEQPIESEKLKARISVRLEDIKELTAVTKKYKQTENEYNVSKSDFVKKQKELKESVKILVEFLKKEDLNFEIQKITKNINEYLFLLLEKIDYKKAENFFKDKEDFLKKINDICDRDSKTLHQLNLIKTSLNSLQKTKQLIKQLSEKKDFLDKVLKVVETERKSYVENILNSISTKVEALYSKLHPKEGLNNIKLFLKPKVQGSLEIRSSFQKKTDIPPQAYFSDSHLDTLGICVFMAMAKYFKSNVIVLDDVLTSADQPHMDRFIKMLQNETKHFNQIIITTHYRRWRERYKFHRQPSSDIELIELHPSWSLEQGIRHSQIKLAIEELENLKNQNPFDRQNVSSKTGVFLERILDHITLLYRLNAPRRPNSSYTLGELINCFSNKFREKMKVKKHDGSEIPLSDSMKELFNIAEPIRNQVGSHWNELGMDISDQEVMLFLDITIEIGKNFICSECKGLPIKEKSDCWNCSCGKTSLYPLRK